MNVCKLLTFAMCYLTGLTYIYGAPSVFPTGMTIYQSQAVYNGYTLYSSYVAQAKSIVALDMNGNVVNTWQSPIQGYHIGYLAKPLPNGHVMTWLVASSKDKMLVEMDWNGNIVWQFYQPRYSYLHHDFQRLSNGNTLILAGRRKTISYISPHKIKDDIIIEVDLNGNIIWQWSTASHYSQLGLSPGEQQSIFLDNRSDVFHTNSIQALPPNVYEINDSRFKAGNILVSQRNTNIVFIIDRASKKIVWKNQTTIGQHHAKMIPAGLPGAGNILLFDNGGSSGYGPGKRYRFFSRVLEIDPLSQNVVWKYTGNVSQNPKKSFFSYARSSAQRLPNGNTLITEAEGGRMFEVASDGSIVWEYINPHFDIIGAYDYTNWVYRGYRVEPTWINGAIGYFPW